MNEKTSLEKMAKVAASPYRHLGLYDLICLLESKIADNDRLRGLLRELHECGAVTNWMRVSDDLRGRVLAAIGAADQPPAVQGPCQHGYNPATCWLCEMVAMRDKAADNSTSGAP